MVGILLWIKLYFPDKFMKTWLIGSPMFTMRLSACHTTGCEASEIQLCRAQNVQVVDGQQHRGILNIFYTEIQGLKNTASPEAAIT